MPIRNTIVALYLAGAALAAVLFFPVQTIEVRSRRADQVIFREKSAPGDVLTFAYIHSIEKIPVEGDFAVEKDGALRVLETRFPSYAAGLPAPMATRSQDGQWFVIPGGHRLTQFSFYISEINHSSLRIRGKVLDLNHLIESGDIVTVAVRRYPHLLVLLGLI